MKKSSFSKWNTVVPIVALSVIAIQVFLVKQENLSRWKGGGFGMYSEPHYHMNEIRVSNLEIPLDSLIKQDPVIERSIKKLKSFPTDINLKKTTQLLLNKTKADSITVQVWKPYIDMENSTYNREMINKLKLVH